MNTESTLGWSGARGTAGEDKVGGLRTGTKGSVRIIADPRAAIKAAGRLARGREQVYIGTRVHVFRSQGDPR